MDIILSTIELTPFFNVYSFTQRILEATFDDYVFPCHLNIGLDLMLKNIFDNNQ